MNIYRFSLPALALLGLALSPAAHAQSYQFTSFDGPVQTTAGATLVATTVNGISNSGVVVGFTSDNNGVFTNFSGTPGTPGALTALNLSGTANANAINTSRQVVGANGTQAFTLNSISPTNSPLPLPPVNGTTTSEAAFGINDNGIIVGQYTDSNTGTTPGFVDVNGAYTTLNPTAPINGALVVNAQGINNNGLVTGFYATNANATDQHGFLFDTKTSAYTLLPDPSTAKTANGNLALTQFLGINDMGEAVGYYQTKDTGSQFGFLFNTSTNAYTFLDDPLAAQFNGAQITQITGINDAGQIAGFFIGANGVQQGFIAAPVPETSTTISLGLLLVLGVGGMAWRARKRCIRA